MRNWQNKKMTTAALCLALAMFGCGDDDGGGTGGGGGSSFQTEETRTIEVQRNASGLLPGDTVEISVGAAVPGEAFAAASFRLSNAGNSPLSVYTVTVTSDPPLQRI